MGDDPLVPATWALVAATAILAILTAVLAYHAKREADAAREAGQHARAQATAAADGLELSRRMLAEAERQWADRMPLELALALPDSRAGFAVLEVANRTAGAIMVLERCWITDLDAGTDGEPLTPAPSSGTLGVGQGYAIPHTWDHTRRGQRFALWVTGHRIGGPSMDRQWILEVGADGTLSDIAVPVPTALFIGSA